MCTAHPTCHYANGTYYQYDTSGNMTYDGHYIFDYDPENRLNKVKRFEQGPTAMALACDTTLTFTSGGDADCRASLAMT